MNAQDEAASGEEHYTTDSAEAHSAHALATTRRGLFWSFVLTGAFFVVELIVGLSIGSVAVVADAAHNFSAAAGVGIALLAAIFAARPPSPERTFGYVKAEMLAAWINGSLLLAMAVLIVWMGISKLFEPETIATGPMLLVAAIGLVIGGVPAVVLFNKQKTDINVRGAFWHVMETVFGSAAVLVAALLVRYANWSQADAILGMLLAPVLLIAAWSIIRESTGRLLDLTPKNLDLVEVREEIEAIPGVRRAHHIHAWSLGVGKDVFSAHVLVNNEADGQDILEQATALLSERHSIYFTTIQVESRCHIPAASQLDFV